uniref:WRKY transcription factor 20 n=1 Tax=Santalum album TaxID=35974 RepID=A0A650C346_SANAL|nr:WRKY transcription factor 20 [Santalum album]
MATGRRCLEIQKPSSSGVHEEEEGDEYEEEEEEEEEEDEIDSEDEERRAAEFQRVQPELRNAQLQTLTAEPSSLSFSKNDLQSDLVSSSPLLSVLPLNYATEADFKEQAGMSHKEVLINERALSLQEVEPSGCPLSSSEFSPTSVTHSISAIQSPSVPEQKATLVPKFNGVIVEVDNRASKLKRISASPVVKTPSSDGYKWRKYGQKQVKSPEGSRSYYRCTYSDCYAKKIECSDQSGGVMEMIYKGQHNHEPPQKVNLIRESTLVSHDSPVVEFSNTSNSVQNLSASDPSTCSKEPTQETAPTPERKRHNSDGSDGNNEIKVEDEHLNEPEPKRRGKTSSLERSSSPIRPGKKPKFVVHAASDVGISEDGYRWRKYGQKMVKGNPHPRNYYRCTSAGCPVRKHTETAADNASAVTITYKGIHDHDMPVPKKRNGRPGARLVAAAAPTSMDNMQLKKAEAIQTETRPTQWSVDGEGELTGEAVGLGGEKAVESARTLLSIGFEIKPC